VAVSRLGLVAALGGLLGVSGACHGPLLKTGGDMIEKPNTNLAWRQYKSLATIAGGGGSHIDLQMSVTVRSQLADSGFTVVRRSGRWADERSAVRAICSPDAVPLVDGVVFVWYDRLELRDCQNEVVAYEISGTASHGITDMTNRLIAYLRHRDAQPGTAGTAAQPEAEIAADTTTP
jgi:hypothetical protein